MTDQETDVLIVGGGPAGLTLAILAGQMGFSCRVFEAVQFPRVHHGDTLPAGIHTYFEMLGISRERLMRDALPYSGHELHWGQEKSVVTEIAGCSNDGFTITREFLEPMLRDRALELGTPIEQPCSVESLLMEQGRVCGIKTDRGSFRSHFVIDAAGAQHWLARQLGIPIDFYSPPLYGYYNWAKGHCSACYDRPLIYDEPLGWTWISRVQNPDLYQFTRMVFEKQKNMRPWQPPEFQKFGLKPAGPTRGADMTWRMVSRPAGPGYFMLGDAVRRNDPMSNRGFELALVDAFKVALLINKWRRRECSESEMANTYVQETCTYYLNGLRSSYEFLRSHPGAPDWLKTESVYHRCELPLARHQSTAVEVV